MNQLNMNSNAASTTIAAVIILMVLILWSACLSKILTPVNIAKKE